MDTLKQFIKKRKILSAEQREKVAEEVSKSSSPAFEFFLLVVLSSTIATFGLLTNSPAVIIGAMLVAPLMTPIVGVGLASNTGDDRLFSSSISALFRGAFLALIIAVVLTLLITGLPIISLQEIPHEIISRTKPTIVDLGIALAGGMAGAYALSTPSLFAALPGVAISTAILPPLCAIGIGIALGRWDIAGGAFLLFLTNAVTIAFASSVVFFWLGYYPRRRAKAEGNNFPKTIIVSAILTMVILVSLAITGYRIFNEASEYKQINTVINQELDRFGNVDLVSLEVTRIGKQYHLDITIRTGSPLIYQQVVDLQQYIVDSTGKPISLSINQVFAEKLDPLLPPTPTYSATPTYTKTPGPSPTVTPSKTFIPTTTSTNTSTAMPYYTATATETSTPLSAKVFKTSIPPLNLYQSPNGPIIGNLKNGDEITVLHEYSTNNGISWVKVVDREGRIGWIPIIYIHVLTQTPESK